METEQTKLIMEKFNDLKDYSDAWKAGSRLRMMLLASIKYMPNPSRRWWQFWRPRKIDNPDYDPCPVEIDIVRGIVRGIQPNKPWPRPDKPETTI